MTRRDRNTSLLPTSLLLLAACGGPLDAVDGDTVGGDTSGGNTVGGDTAGGAWSAEVGRRLEAEAVAFQAAGEGFVAQQPLMGMGVEVQGGGVWLSAGEDRVGLHSRGLSRGSPVPRRAPMPARWGACEPSGALDAEGACVRRAERAGDGITEWWSSTPGRVQVGWELTRSPPGGGPLSILLEVEGAEVTPGAAPGAMSLVAPDHEFVLEGLVAWDDDGVTLPAWMEANEGGLQVRIDDTGARWPIHVDPITYTTGWSQSGSGASNYGTSVSMVGDLNFDGFDDVAVSAPAYSTNTGRVYIYHGAIAGLSTSAALTLTGASTQLYFGRSVAGAGDVNGDGFDDLIVGADGVSSSTGAAYLYHGSSTGLSSLAAATLTGVSAAGQFGAAVSSAGDVNGDGFSDVVVGALAADSPNNVGAAYVYHGAYTGLSTTAARILGGAGSGASFGADVAAAGDVNQDGYDDLIVGAPTYGSTTGYVEVYHGSASGLSATAALQLSGTAALQRYGASVAGAGDVDGDGYDDVIIGAWGTSAYTGQAQVFHGSASGLGATAAITVSGPGTSDFGFSVGAAGDMNDDGYDDVVVGGYLYSASFGLVRTYAGSAVGLSTDYLGTVSGSSTSCLGYSVSGGGDVNGDGLDDILAGAYCATSGNGYAAVYYGSADTDGDGYFRGSGVSASLRDCDDDDALINPGVTDTVDDGIDNNCDGSESCWDDDDDDGYLDLTADKRSSTDLDCRDAKEGEAADPTTDCDDTDAGDHPGATETVGNGDDEDCDGGEVCYLDADDDGYIITAATTVTSVDSDCNDAYESTSTSGQKDCDDTSSAIRPGATEVTGDEIDQNCDGGESCYDDDDDDGYLDTARDTRSSADTDCQDAREGTSADLTTDCADSDASRYPGAPEIVANAVDEDCDGAELCYLDADDDGYLDTSGATLSSTDSDCTDATEGRSTDPTTDCDDSAASIRPGATEVVADGIDEDCDGSEECYVDADDDGYLSSSPATATSADSDCDDPTEGLLTELGTDCDDGDAAISPSATELCDAADVDEDCDGLSDDADPSADPSGMSTWPLDADGDGYGDDAWLSAACDLPSGSATIGGDCDDGDARVYPLAAEIPGDGLDEDCSGTELCYTDAVESIDLSCTTEGLANAAVQSQGEDCLDSDPRVNPAAQEICDEINQDEDCDGLSDDEDDSAEGQFTAWLDADADGYGEAAESVSACDPGPLYALLDGDCDDADPTVNPGAEERCNEVDDDCDGGVDAAAVDAPTWYPDADRDGYGSELGVVACDQPEGFVDNGLDCDDEDDEISPEATELCDELDNDCDGAVDPDGTCASDEADSGDGGGDGSGEGGDGAADGDVGKAGCGCTTQGGPAGAAASLLGVLGLVAGRRRRALG
jgi:MYXO-CTERM domain-containing protein